MASHAPGIELADISDLADLVDEVRRSRRPCTLRQGGQDVAVLVPVPTPRARPARVNRPRPPTAEEIARSRAGIEASAGTWKDVDVDALQRELRRQRDVTTRPAVEL
jgi:hypothetical protein